MFTECENYKTVLPSLAALCNDLLEGRTKTLFFCHATVHDLDYQGAVADFMDYWHYIGTDIKEAEVFMKAIRFNPPYYAHDNMTEVLFSLNKYNFTQKEVEYLRKLLGDKTLLNANFAPSDDTFIAFSLSRVLRTMVFDIDFIKNTHEGWVMFKITNPYNTTMTGVEKREMFIRDLRGSKDKIKKMIKDKALEATRPDFDRRSIQLQVTAFDSKGSVLWQTYDEDILELPSDFNGVRFILVQKSVDDALYITSPDDVAIFADKFSFFVPVKQVYDETASKLSTDIIDLLV